VNRNCSALLFAALLFSLGFVSLSGQESSVQDPPEGSPDEEGWEEDFPGEEFPLMEGGGITVVGTADTTKQIETLEKEAIEKSHAPDIPALLEESLGLGVTRYGPYGNQADINIRGFDTERVAVLVDGVPVNSAHSGDFDFNSIDMYSIERIEVVHGGSDTKYNVSGALGGVINFITVKKQKPGWSFGGGFSNTSALPGRYNRQYGGEGTPQWQDVADTQNLRAYGAYGAESWSLRANLFGNRAGNHFLYQDDYGYARRKEGNEVWDGGASVSALKEFSDFSKLIMTGTFHFAQKQIPSSGHSADYADQRDLSSRENILFDMPRAFHDDFSMELSLGHGWVNLEYDPGREASRHSENDLNLINRWGWYPLPEFTLRFGGDYRFIHLDSTNAGVRYGNRGGLYAGAEYAPVKKLLLIASIKAVTDGQVIIPVPKLGLSWALADFLTLKNNYFRSFKFPDFDDLYWVQSGYRGNPDLKNEDGWGADIVAELSYKRLNLNSALYGQWTENSIHWNNASGLWRPENIGTGAFFGWDNRLKLKLPLSVGRLEEPVLSLSWLFCLSWLLSGDLSFGDQVRIPYMPLHTLAFSLELPWKTGKGLPGSFALSGRFESRRYADTGNVIELAPVFLLNAVFNQKLNEHTALFGALHNALNARYVSFADYPMPGITATVGINLDF
jgi:vitamin B12 transporter